jgi:hypothetical protein
MVPAGALRARVGAEGQSHHWPYPLTLDEAILGLPAAVAPTCEQAYPEVADLGRSKGLR